MNGKLCMRKVDGLTIFGEKSGDEIIVKNLFGPNAGSIMSNPVPFTEDTVVYDAEVLVIDNGYAFISTVKDIVSTTAMGIFGKKATVDECILLKADGENKFSSNTIIILVNGYAIIVSDSKEGLVYMASLDLNNKKACCFEEMVNMHNFKDVLGYEGLLGVLSSAVGFGVKELLFHELKPWCGFIADLFCEVDCLCREVGITSDYIKFGSLKGKMVIAEGSPAFAIKYIKDGKSLVSVCQTIFGFVKNLKILNIKED